MRSIVICVLVICLFSGCKKKIFENIIFKNSFQCTINGRECYSDERNFGPNGVILYSYEEETKKFNLRLPDYQIYEKNSTTTTSYRLHLGLCTKGWPEIGKKYEMNNDDSLYRYVFEKDACWVAFAYVTPFYNYIDTTLLPKEIRKQNSVVRSKKIKGYIVFDKIEEKIFSGRFNFYFEGENSCYPDNKVQLSVENGKFKLYFWDEPARIGNPYFTKVESLWECYESEE